MPNRFFAGLTVAAIFLIYCCIMTALGSTRGGGILPMMLLMAICGWTWRAMTKEKEIEKEEG